ncbi:MAG: hypothetical protein K1X28_03665 [Parachlamydiales bacterium]|nr:hypothetical protein [Parachlamydiales bacterium]
MEISLDTNNSSEELLVLLKHKMNTDEEIVRHELVRVWTKMLEKYAQPGVQIPPAWVIRQEMLDKGINAAVSAVCDEHWFVFSWMIEDQVRENVEKGLAKFNLEQFIADVRVAQHDPWMLNHLREQIRYYILVDV